MLQWKGNQAFWNEQLVFSVEKEKHGWKLYRYTERNGERVFKSKESVTSFKAGKDYAHGLAKLWRI